MTHHQTVLSLLAFLPALTLQADDVSLIRVGEAWRFFRGTAEPSSPTTAWRQVDFDGSAWETGPSGFSAAGDEGASLAPLATRSVYFRKLFTVSDPQAVKWTRDADGEFTDLPSPDFPRTATSTNESYEVEVTTLSPQPATLFFRVRVLP